MSVIRDQRSPPLGPTGATDIVCQNKFTSDGEASAFEVVHGSHGALEPGLPMSRANGRRLSAQQHKPARQEGRPQPPQLMKRLRDERR
jgi:hypothetical protein